MALPLSVMNQLLSLGTSGIDALKKNQLASLAGEDDLSMKDKIAKARKVNLVEGGADAAKAGMTMGPIGAAISIIKSISGNKQEEKAIRDEYRNVYRNAYTTAIENDSYAKGGKVTGKGTTKSDSVNMKSKSGSFIVPAENSPIAMALGKAYLGWDNKQMTKKSKPGKKIKTSNGEVEFTPEEAMTLSALGIDLNKLAPESEGAKSFKKGGFNIPDKDWEDFWALSPATTPEDEIKPLNIKTSEADPSSYSIGQKGKKFLNNLSGTNIPELLGAGQIATGLAGFGMQGKEPELSVNPRLKRMFSEAREDAKIGISPAERAMAETNIIRSTNNAISQILGEDGSNAAKYNRVVSALNEKNRAFAEIAATSEGIKREKKGVERAIEGQIIGREDKIDEVNLQRFDERSSAFGDLVNAGIQNIVGSKKLREQLERQKVRDKMGQTIINLK